MRTGELRLNTGDRLVTDLTGYLESWVESTDSGLLNVFVPHATAGIAIIETGAGTEPDVAAALERLLPTADIYVHRHGSLGHGRDHVMPAFVSPSVTVPVVAGRMQLGTWQSVCLIDPNGDNPHRRVVLSFLAG
jgi:secondary thiamine-phosphate synthase enzyme